MSSHFPEWSEADKARVRARIDAKMAELDERIRARKIAFDVTRLNLKQEGEATAPDLQVA